MTKSPYCVVRFTASLSLISEITTWLADNGYPLLGKMSFQRKWVGSRKVTRFFKKYKSADKTISLDLKMRREDVVMLVLREPRVLQPARRSKSHHPAMIMKRQRF